MIYKGSHVGINVVIWEKQAFIPYAYSDDNAKSWKKLNPDIKQIKSPNSVMNPKEAYSQAIRFRRLGRDVPNKMLEGIASKPTLALKYIRDILNFTNIPDILLHSIARESYLSHEYAQAMNGSDIPDFILKSIASEGGVAFTYADRTLNWKNIPSLIHKSILDANYGKHIPKTATFMESFNELYTVLLEKYTKKKKKKVSKLRSTCQSKAKAKYDVWPSAYACVPESSSKALTREGWKSVHELSINEDILTFNIDKNELEFSPIQHIHRYESADTKIVRSGQTGFLFECTGNHKWVVRSAKKRPSKKNNYSNDHRTIELLETDNILKFRNNKNLVVSAPYYGGEGITKDKIYKYGDNWIKYLLDCDAGQRQSWLFSAIVYDGDQKKTERVLEKSDNKDVLEWEYDGNYGKQSFGFKQKDIMHRDAFLLSAFLNEGSVTWIKSKTRDIYSCHYVSNKSCKNTSNFKLQSVNNCDVWCPQTENKTWVMMQETEGRGIITITGNSGYVQKCVKRKGKMN